MKLGSISEGRFGGIAILHAEAVEYFSCVSRLREVNWSSGCRSIDVHAEKAFDGSEIVNSVGLLKLCVDFVDFVFGVCENEKVVDIYCDDRVVAVVLLSNE